MRKEKRTDLLSQHLPLEPGKVLHRPDIVSPSRNEGSYVRAAQERKRVQKVKGGSSLLALGSSNRLCIQHLSCTLRDGLVQELDPRLCITDRVS
jgi:hypothetical protein